MDPGWRDNSVGSSDEAKVRFLPAASPESHVSQLAEGAHGSEPAEGSPAGSPPLSSAPAQAPLPKKAARPKTAKVRRRAQEATDAAPEKYGREEESRAESAPGACLRVSEPRAGDRPPPSGGCGDPPSPQPKDDDGVPVGSVRSRLSSKDEDTFIKPVGSTSMGGFVRELTNSKLMDSKPLPPVTSATVSSAVVSNYRQPTARELCEAARAGNVFKLKKILTRAGKQGRALLQEPDEKGRLAIHIAAHQGHAQACTALLEAAKQRELCQLDERAKPPGSLVYAESDYMRPLHFAILKEDPRTIEAFLLAGDHPTSREVSAALLAHSDVACKVLEAMFVPAYEDNPEDMHPTAYVFQDPKTIFVHEERNITWKENGSITVNLPEQHQSTHEIRKSIHRGRTVDTSDSGKIYDKVFNWCKCILDTLNFCDMMWAKESRFFEPRPLGRLGAEKGPYQLYVTQRDAADGFMSSQVFKSLALTSSPSACGTLTARCLISAAWDQVFACYMIDILLNVLSMALLSWVTWQLQSRRRVWTSVIWLFLISLKELAAELFQFLELRDQYFSVANGIDGLRIILEIYGEYVFFFQSSKFENPDSTLILGTSLWVAWRWMRLLWGMRGLRWLGPRILPIMSTLYDIAGFCVLLFFALAAATHAYMMMSLNVQETPLKTLLIASRDVYRLAVLADFDLHDLEGKDILLKPQNGTENSIIEEDEDGPYHVAIQIFFLIVSAFVTVMLMNLFIGVLGSNFDRYQDRSEEIFIQTRARIIVDYISVPFFKCMVNLESREGLHMIALARTDAREAQEDGSLRSFFNKAAVGIQHDVKSLTDRVEKIEEQLQPLQSVLRSLDLHLQRLNAAEGSQTAQ